MAMYTGLSLPVYQGGSNVPMEMIGRINNAISAIVTVKDRSDPVLTMTVPYTEEYKNMLTVENYIECKDAESYIDIGIVANPMKFYIQKVNINTKSRTISIVAENEMNYLRNWRELQPYVQPRDGSQAGLAFNTKISANARNRPTGAEPFPSLVNNIEPDLIASQTSWSMPITDYNILEALKGKEGGYIDTYGGAVWKRNGRIKWEKPDGTNVLGRDNGVRIEYGKNVTGIDVEVDITDVVNGAIHYAHTEERPESMWQPDLIFPPLGYKVYNLGTRVWKNGSIVSVDWSDSDPKPTKPTDLTQLYLNWQKANAHLNDPKTSVKIDFVSLRNVKNYEEFRKLEELGLGDVVRVYYAPLGIEIKSNVVGYEYDVLADQYNKLEIGNRKSNILNIINGIYRSK